MKLSVALCTYNGEKFIEQQINSILNQSLKIDEIIVCDDQSSDNTIAILKKLQDKYSCIQIVENEANLKSSKNFQKAIELATGDYIFLSDQDDIWKIDKVLKTVSIFTQNPKAEGVFSNAELIDENNSVFTNKTIWDSVFFYEKELKKPIDFFDIMCKNGNVVTGATLCIKKEIKSFIFPFSDENHHDEWIASLLAIRSTLFYSPENLIFYRIHKKQQVGMKRLNADERIIHRKRIILGLKKPRSFFDYLFLLKKIFIKQKEILSLKRYNFEFVDVDNLALECNNELENVKEITKSKFPVHYFIISLIDTISGKRKL